MSGSDYGGQIASEANEESQIASEPNDEIGVATKARSRPDRAGDPLDGLVNLFDLGIVLAVAFLLAALSSLQLSDLLTSSDVSVVRQEGNNQTVITKKDNKVQSVDLTKQKVVGQGTRVGTVYRLEDGRTVVVQDGGTTGASGATGPTGLGGVAPDSGTTTPAPDTGSTPADPGSTTPAVPTPPDSGSGGLTSPFG